MLLDMLPFFVGLICFFGNFALVIFLFKSYENGWPIVSKRKTLVGKILGVIFYILTFVLQTIVSIVALIFMAGMLGLK